MHVVLVKLLTACLNINMQGKLFVYKLQQCKMHHNIMNNMNNMNNYQYINQTLRKLNF